MSRVFASFNFEKRAKIRENTKFNLAKINPIKVMSQSREKLVTDERTNERTNG